MSTNERDELEQVTCDTQLGRLVKHSDARRIVDDLKAKLAEVTRERDEIASRFIGVVPDGGEWGIVCDGGKPVYATVIEACEAADKINRAQLTHHQNAEYEWRQKFHELERQVSAGIQPSVQLVLDRMNEWNKQRDQIASLEHDLAQAREQLEAVQAEAAAMREAFAKRVSFGCHFWNGANDFYIRFNDAQKARDCEHAIGSFLQGTAGRDLLEEMRRKDERIAELERYESELSTVRDLVQKKHHMGGVVHVGLLCVAQAVKDLIEKIPDVEGPSVDGDQPTPQPVYWRCGWITSAQEQGRPDYRCIDGLRVQISSEQVDEWVDYPASVADMDGRYPRCNRDGTPIVSNGPSPEWLARMADAEDKCQSVAAISPELLTMVEDHSSDGTPIVKPEPVWQYRSRNDDVPRWRTSDGVAIELFDKSQRRWIKSYQYQNWQACVDDPATYACNESGERIEMSEFESEIVNRMQAFNDKLASGEEIRGTRVTIKGGEVTSEKDVVVIPARKAAEMIAKPGAVESLAESMQQEADPLKVGDWVECIDNGGQHVLVDGWPRKVLQSFGHEVRIEGVGVWASCRFRRVPAPSGDDSEPGCESCGVPYEDHLGLIGTCKQLQEAKAAIHGLVQQRNRLSNQLAEQAPLVAIARDIVDAISDGGFLTGESNSPKLGDHQVVIKFCDIHKMQRLYSALIALGVKLRDAKVGE